MIAKAAPATEPKSRNPEMDHPAAMLMLRGAIAIAFGVVAFLWPDLTLLWLVAMFAVYALLGGAVSIATALRMRGHERRWWLPLLLGIVSIIAAVYALFAPALTALVLVLVIGANAIVTGVLDIAIAVRLRKVLKGPWMLILGGAASIAFGTLVFVAPQAGALALVWLISLHAVVTGVLLLSLGLRTRRAARGGPLGTALAGGR
jgi:uncharacterized membrane protein HdeD (DUF308 family)